MTANNSHNICARGCPTPPTGTTRLCPPCTARIRHDLNTLPDLVAAAASRADGRLTPHTDGGDPTRHATHTPTSPSPAWDTAEETLQWVYSWALTAADALHLNGPFHYRTNGVPDCSNIRQLVDLITLNLDWYTTNVPLTFYDEVTAERRRLEHLTGLDQLIHRIRQPCPSCDHRTLTRDDGASDVTCRNPDCARVWREDEFPWMARVAARGAAS